MDVIIATTRYPLATCAITNDAEVTYVFTSGSFLDRFTAKMIQIGRFYALLLVTHKAYAGRGVVDGGSRSLHLVLEEVVILCLLD